MHGCLTGDCPHDSINECLPYIVEHVEDLKSTGLELADEVERLSTMLYKLKDLIRHFNTEASLELDDRFDFEDKTISKETESYESALDYLRQYANGNESEHPNLVKDGTPLTISIVNSGHNSSSHIYLHDCVLPKTDLDTPPKI